MFAKISLTAAFFLMVAPPMASGSYRTLAKAATTSQQTGRILLAQENDQNGAAAEGDKDQDNDNADDNDNDNDNADENQADNGQNDNNQQMDQNPGGVFQPAPPNVFGQTNNDDNDNNQNQNSDSGFGDAQQEHQGVPQALNPNQ